MVSTTTPTYIIRPSQEGGYDIAGHGRLLRNNNNNVCGLFFHVLRNWQTNSPFLSILFFVAIIIIVTFDICAKMGYHHPNVCPFKTTMSRSKADRPIFSPTPVLIFHVDNFTYEPRSMVKRIDSNDGNKFLSIVHESMKNGSKIVNLVEFNYTEMVQLYHFIRRSIECPYNAGFTYRVDVCPRLIPFERYIYACCSNDSSFLNLRIYSARFNSEETIDLIKRTKGLIYKKI
jgi:hypothetical protein